MIALSDRVYGRTKTTTSSSTPRSRRSASTGRARPRRCRRVLGIPRTGTAAGGRRPAEQTAGAPPPTFEAWSGAEPAGARSRRRCSLRLRLVRLRLHRLVHARRPRSSGPTPNGSAAGEIVRQVRAWDAELPARDGVDVVTELLNRVTPRFPAHPSGSRSGWSASPSGGRGTGGHRHSLDRRGTRPPDPCRVSGCHARVRAPALPGVHRDCARRSRGNPANNRMGSGSSASTP